MFYVLTALVAAGTAFVFSIVIWKLALKYRLHPAVRDRDVHTQPTPRLGGIAMFIGVLVAFAFASQVPWFDLVFADPGPILAILGSALIIVLVGVADDIWDLDWMTKLAAQIIAAGLLAWQGVAIVSLPIGGVAVGSSTMSLIGTILVVVVVMNAVNFIDGLDGLVAGVVIIGNGVFFLYTFVLTRVIGEAEYFNLSALISVILVGACLGFLPLNWHPAKMFMGDAGALLSGLLMAASAISVTGQISVPAVVAERTLLLPAFIPVVLPLAILILPLLDFSLAVLRRLRAGKSPFAADRKHIHHRLLDLGHSHFHAVLLFYGWTTVVSVGCLLFLFLEWRLALTLIGLGIAACTVVTIAPVVANHRRRIAEERAAALAPAGASPRAPEPRPGAPVNASIVFRRALVLSLVLAAVIAVVGGVVSGLIVGQDGVLSVLVGTAMAVVFAGITVVSLIVAIKYDITVFFGIIMGAWLLKAVLFIIVLVLLRDAAFIHDWSLFLSIVAAVVGTLVIDAVVVAKGRLGYVSDVELPGAPTGGKADDQA